MIGDKLFFVTVSKPKMPRYNLSKEDGTSTLVLKIQIRPSWDLNG